MKIKNILTFNKDKIVKYNKFLLYLKFINNFFNSYTIILSDIYYGKDGTNEVITMNFIYVSFIVFTFICFRGANFPQNMHFPFTCIGTSE